MALFTYTAINKSGERITGEIEALRREAVLRRLAQLDQLPVEIAEVRDGTDDRRPHAWFARRPSTRRLTLLTRELAMLLKAGTTLDGALAMLEQTHTADGLVAIIGRLRTALSNGRSLSQGLEDEGGLFPLTYINMVRVAEESGTLAAVLDRIAKSRERDEKLRAKLLSALMYPALLVCTGIGAIVLMFCFVVPRFKAMLAGMRSELPPSTAFLIDTSDWLIANGLYLGLGVGLAIIVASTALRLRSTHRILERIALGLPLAGPILRLATTVRFARALAILLENGVELARALQLVAPLLRSEKAHHAVASAREALRRGDDFAEPLKLSGAFAPSSIELLKVSEEAGSLPVGAAHIAEIYEEQLETRLARTFTLLEPIVIITVAVFVAGTMFAIINGIISVNDITL